MTITQAAINKAIEFNKEHPTWQLQIAIKGGGCSGLLYDLKFVNYDVIMDFEKIILDGLTVIIDKKSAAILEETELDYVDGLQGSGFQFNNPSATGTCGCGSSFGCP